jgi:hypothetical protein
VITCFPHSSTPKRPSLWAFHEAKGRRVLVDVVTTKPERSPEYMRSLSSETNRALMGELCDRIMCNGGGADAREDIETKTKISSSWHEGPFPIWDKAQLIPDLLYNAKLKKNKIHLPPKKEDQDPCSPGICSFVTMTKDSPSRSVITVVL